ncbi:MAG: hypothetical protein B1H04_04435 [Planctomycetales bacterium 4484_123]|nr:MAG: hypothetical protein B1H04_04435 [Planctomycetales bacterium 4484_123]
MTVAVTDEYHIAHARQLATAMAAELGFPPVLACYVATSVSELASNLVFHATDGGTITLGPVRRAGQVGIEITCKDNGPGIPDLHSALQDGFSTNGGLGGGLPGVRRLMDDFEIITRPGAGTRIVARKWLSCQWQ